METVAVKSDYETPELKAHGSVETVTQHATDGSSLDAGFSAGTPGAVLTFS